MNSNNILNVGSYVRTVDQKPFFDVAIIFAANINYDTEKRKAVFFANENVKAVLDNKKKYIEPLQKTGIKVVLSILGNHQGAGIANFPNREAARDFAKQLADVVEPYNLDSIDLDDEYSEYERNTIGAPNSRSLIMLLQELRLQMPSGKIISCYYIGPSSRSLEWKKSRSILEL